MNEVKTLDRFFEMLDQNPDRFFAFFFEPLFSLTRFVCSAFYGFKHVNLANENSAIEILLITDELFRYLKIDLQF